jgi:NADH-quinone oxidoreductase subunit M
MLTGIGVGGGGLFSWNVTHRVKEFFALYFALIGAVYGVFLSLDLFLLFVFYELAIIPKYFLIAIWGSTNREYGAMKLALYSFVGSAMVLIGLVAAYVVAGSTTMNLLELARFSFEAGFQRWAFPLMFVGFAILAGLMAVSHLGADRTCGGADGGIDVVGGGGDEAGGVWRAAGGVAVVSGGRATGQMPLAMAGGDRDCVWGIGGAGAEGFQVCDRLFEREPHGFRACLGLMTFSVTGMSGAVLQMFSHGIIAGLLFAVVGRMVYDRAHTRDLTELEGCDCRGRCRLRR